VPGGKDERLGARIPDLLLDLPVSAGAGTVGGTRLYELLREIGPGQFVRLILSDEAAEPGPGSAPSDDTGGGDEVVTVAARSVLGPDWALREGWGSAESVLVRPDGHVADISSLAPQTDDALS
jgi:hypothetical protein